MKRSVFIYWFFVFIYAALIFSLSSRPNLSVSHDKILHTLEYGIFGFLLTSAVAKQFDLKGVRLAIWVVLIGTLFGVTDEIHQYFIPGRSCSAADAAADFLGSLIGVFFYVSISRIQRPLSAGG
jgi:VanZ family protein